MRPESDAELWAILAAICAKIGPGLLGSLVALRFQPENSTFGDRLFSFLLGVGLAAVFGPAFVEIFDIDEPFSQYAVGVIVAIFGLMVIGEIVKAIKEVGFAEFLKDWAQRMFGPGGPK